VGTVKKSIETRSRTWLVRNVRQVCEEGARALREQRGDRPLGDFNPELQEFPMDSGSAPQRIGGGHFSDEVDDLGVDRWAADPALPRELGPVLAETASLPTHDGVGSHEHERLPPAGPNPGEPNPEQAICSSQPRPAERSFIHADLVTQREVLQG
jgi:hypothetical protein